MSTLAYSSLTTKRDEAAPGTSTKDAPPGVHSYVDALAALVPVEVLTIHALILNGTTNTTESVANATVPGTATNAMLPTTIITNPGVLKQAFWGLMVLSVVIYVGSRLLKGALDRLDIGRAAIPALAFVGWTMLQRSTAFDAVFPQISGGARLMYGVFLAVFLGVLASYLASLADKKPAPAPPA